jgi:hypothetical protein
MIAMTEARNRANNGGHGNVTAVYLLQIALTQENECYAGNNEGLNEAHRCRLATALMVGFPILSGHLP